MRDGRAIMRGGRALMATSGSPCCCGPGGPCDFTSTPCFDCLGSTGCAPQTKLAFRQIRTRSGGGPILTSRNEWPVTFCCGDTTDMPYSSTGTFKQSSYFCPTMDRGTSYTATGVGPSLLATRVWYSNTGPPNCVVSQSAAPAYPFIISCDDGAVETGVGLVPLLNALQHFSGGPAAPFDPLWDNVVEIHTFIPGSFREYAYRHTFTTGGQTIIENVYVREYWGPNPNCYRGPSCPPVGACCCDGTCYSELTQAECLAGQGTWKGQGSICNGQTCGNACCVPDFGCTFMDPAACFQFGGLVVENCGSACPAFGACCNPTTGGCTHTRLEDCLFPNTFQGLGSNCFNLARPGCPQPLGRCCIPTTGGGFNCAGATQAQCAALNGTGWAPGTTCQSHPCPTTGGACCMGNGECNQVNNPQDCINAGGAFMGVGSDCQTTLCVTACCLGGFCEPRPIPQCFALGGTPTNEPTCDPDPCNVGACCCGTPGSYSCSQTTQLGCLGPPTNPNPNCFWFGQGVGCSPNPCNFGPLQLPNHPKAIIRPRRQLVMPDGSPVSSCSSCGQGQKRTEL